MYSVYVLPGSQVCAAESEYRVNLHMWGPRTCNWQVYARHQGGPTVCLAPATSLHAVSHFMPVSARETRCKKREPNQICLVEND